jgi:hypothetical protein
MAPTKRPCNHREPNRRGVTRWLGEPSVKIIFLEGGSPEKGPRDWMYLSYNKTPLQSNLLKLQPHYSNLAVSLILIEKLQFALFFKTARASSVLKYGNAGILESNRSGNRESLYTTIVYKEPSVAHVWSVI